MVRSIVPELSQGKPTPPLLGSVVNKAVQEHLDALINTFTLPVSLGMVGCGKLQLGSQ
jgi:hypothetical protein